MIQTWQETLITAQSDGSALTAAAAASCIPAAAKYTLPANFFDRIGQKLQIKASGRISSVNTTPGVARFDLRFGAAVVFDGLGVLLDTVASRTNQPWFLDVEMTLRAVGATANFMGQGIWVCEDILGVPATTPKGALVGVLPWGTAPAVGANFDSTATQQIDFFFTQTVATGSMTLHQFELIAKN